MYDKEYVNDSVMLGVSNCCGSRVFSPDICSSCFGHCAVEDEISEDQILDAVDEMNDLEVKAIREED